VHKGSSALSGFDRDTAGTDGGGKDGSSANKGPARIRQGSLCAELHLGFVEPTSSDADAIFGGGKASI